jgi:hypothetical protein
MPVVGDISPLESGFELKSNADYKSVQISLSKGRQYSFFNKIMMHTCQNVQWHFLFSRIMAAVLAYEYHERFHEGDRKVGRL